LLPCARAPCDSARDKPTMRDGAMSSRLACGIAVPRVCWRIEQVLVQLEIEPTPELESGMANHAAGLEPELQVQGPARVVGRLDSGDHVVELLLARPGQVRGDQHAAEPAPSVIAVHV